MSGRERELVAAFASELPRGTGLPTTLCGSRAAWTQGPPALSGSADLIVTGSCAALLPGVPVGSLVLPARLRSHAGDELAPDAGLREALGQGLLRAGTMDDFTHKAWAMRDAFDGILNVVERQARQAAP